MDHLDEFSQNIDFFIILCLIIINQSLIVMEIWHEYCKKGVVKIKIELARSQFLQLSDLLRLSRSFLDTRETGEIKLETQTTPLQIQWTSQTVEIDIPD